MSGERAFSFSRGASSFFQGVSEMTRAETGVGAGASASRTALKIYCKSSLEYLGTLVVAGGALAIKGFDFKGPTG